MRLFLDASVLLAACGSRTGASAELTRLATPNQWTLLSSEYILAEVETNLSDLQSITSAANVNACWREIRSRLDIVPNILTLDRPVVFEPAKDRPVLFTALAWADVLLTLDRADFGGLMGGRFYGLGILTPGEFLMRLRAAGVLQT